MSRCLLSHRQSPSGSTSTPSASLTRADLSTLWAVPWPAAGAAMHRLEITDVASSRNGVTVYSRRKVFLAADAAVIATGARLSQLAARWVRVPVQAAHATRLPFRCSAPYRAPSTCQARGRRARRTQAPCVFRGGPWNSVTRTAPAFHTVWRRSSPRSRPFYPMCAGANAATYGLARTPSHPTAAR